MAESSLGDIVRQLVADPEYRRVLTSQIAERTLDHDTLVQLIARARARQTTLEAAMVRKVLTDAGVSWEAL